MSRATPDRMVLDDDWSDLARIRRMPDIDLERLHAYRLGRIRDRLRETGAAMCLLVNPVTVSYTHLTLPTICSV